MIKDHFADPGGKIQTTSQGLSPIKPRNKIQILFIVIFVISACGSTPIITQTPKHLPPALPDLVVSTVHIAMQGIPANTTNCVVAYAPYEVRAIIENRGDALATNIPIIELSSNYEIQIGELPAGQSMEVFLPASSPNGTYNVSVDPQNLIAENNENNNTFSYLAITPTPPALCPPTETPFPPSVSTSESGLEQAMELCKQTGVQLVYAQLSRNWVHEAAKWACVNLPKEVAFVMESWRKFGKLPIVEWGRVTGK